MQQSIHGIIKSSISSSFVPYTTTPELYNTDMIVHCCDTVVCLIWTMYKSHKLTVTMVFISLQQNLYNNDHQLISSLAGASL